MRDELKLLTVSNHIYRLLLRAYPAPFRREFGCEMALVFRDDLRATARESGMQGLIGLWLVTFFDLLKTALAEHIWEMFHMPLEKISRWSWLAAAIGAPLFITTFSSEMFWSVIGTIGLADFRFIHPIMAGIGLLLMAFGVYGLYRRLPAHIASTLAFSFTLLAILAGIVLLVMWEQDVPEFLSLVAFASPPIGVAMMGAIALARKSLGNLSFAPLLPLVGFVGVALTFPEVGGISPMTRAFLALHHVGWVLLGIALMMRQPEEPSEPGLFA